MNRLAAVGEGHAVWQVTEAAEQGVHEQLVATSFLSLGSAAAAAGRELASRSMGSRVLYHLQVTECRMAE